MFQCQMFCVGCTLSLCCKVVLILSIHLLLDPSSLLCNPFFDSCRGYTVVALQDSIDHHEMMESFYSCLAMQSTHGVAGNVSLMSSFLEQNLKKKNQCQLLELLGRIKEKLLTKYTNICQQMLQVIISKTESVGSRMREFLNIAHNPL